MTVHVGDKVRLISYQGGAYEVMHQVGKVTRIEFRTVTVNFPAQRGYLCHTNHLRVVTTTKKKGSLMTNIRQKISLLTKSREDRLFEKHGITSDHGNLTDLGRRVVMDKLFADKALRSAVLADVEAVEAENEKASKKSK